MTLEKDTEEEAVGQTGSENFVRGDAARDSFPTQVAAAMKYASDNKYEYGPKLRDSEINWEVDGVASMDGGISRVYVNFRPSSSFRGESGSEYFDVDASGVVLARRQLSVPKEALPIFLIGFAVVSLIALVVVQVLLWANPFEGGPEPYVAGRILWLRVESPKVHPYVTYDAPGATGGGLLRWAIKPEGEGTQLVIVKATLINQTSGAVNMVVDRNAAELRIRGSIGLKPVNILDASYQVDPEADRNYLTDFTGMWGSVTLNQGEQITGHLVFETPVGSDFSEFRWLSGDTAVVRF